MNLTIAGGVGEHGRACFLMEGKSGNVLLDAGLSGNGSHPYPSLSAKQLQTCDYLFLSHSHKDHAGALRHFHQLGFQGTIIATKATIQQLSPLPYKVKYLEELCEELKWQSLQDGLSMCWGNSGHCEGSIWIHIKLDNQSLLYTGDYREQNEPYPCTPIRERYADIAIIDCAYGLETYSKEQYLHELYQTCKTLLQNKQRVLLPVPLYGRGESLYPLCQQWFPNTSVAMYASLETRSSCQEDIVLLQDGQLQHKVHQSIAKTWLQEGGAIVFTGECDHNSFAYGLLKEGRAIAKRYPVHMNYKDATTLIDQNAFDQVILFHSAQVQAI